ncbi:MULTISPECIES: acyl-CoA-binding protein [Galbibacter]|uniref:Acyl-CoA-binding protein n=1 Tax=Galbibacter pacificus TaxID=2996052 RepID=A0ABT6FM17_9FLAO|nr:acyl-CoA-binding protein [Galbibacter pacificus]MDG3580828.1 acyl-CoA-binding protein [Galbibacter pacificus]MDG3584306.1 acyl-CoA-binding protein [Galbibacter pacificus]
MNQEKIDKEFEEAVERVNNYQELFPADFLLRLYAYYKKATQNSEPPSSRRSIINAFKANALFQARGMTENEAKEKYIKLVKEYFKYK